MVWVLKVGPRLVFIRKTIFSVAVLAPLVPEANRQKSLIKRAPHQQIVHSDRRKGAIEATVICQLNVTKVTECVLNSVSLVTVEMKSWQTQSVHQRGLITVVPFDPANPQSRPKASKSSPIGGIRVCLWKPKQAKRIELSNFIFRVGTTGSSLVLQPLTAAHLIELRDMRWRVRVWGQHSVGERARRSASSIVYVINVSVQPRWAVCR